MKYFFLFAAGKNINTCTCEYICFEVFHFTYRKPKKQSNQKAKNLSHHLKNFFRHVNYIDSQTCGHTFLRLHAYCRSQSRAKILLIHTM